MSAVLHLEDDHTYVFDLSKVPGPEAMRREICSVMRTWTTRGLRRSSSVTSVRLSVSILLRWVDLTNREEQWPSIENVESLTAFHIVRFREYLDQKYKVNGRNQYYGDVCRLLEVAGAARSVLAEARKRRRIDAPVTPIVRYASVEYASIVRAARNVVRRAERRITAAYRAALRGGEPGCSSREKALHEILNVGRVLSRQGWEALGLWRNNRGLLVEARNILYPTHDEILAAAVLIACQRGLNLSPIVTSRVPRSIDNTIVQLDLDKPRRGAGRFWPEILDDAGEDKGAASTILRIERMTDPIRHYLAAIGSPSDRLLICWMRASKPRLGLHQQRESSWWPIADPISFNRLRRSGPDVGVAREPTNHTPDTHLHYIRTDPEALLQQREAAAIAALDALERARSALSVRTASDVEADAASDALVVHCTEPERRPTTGHACTSALFSFLDCLECDNAVSVNRLLPRQMAALSVLEHLRDVAGDRWTSTYSRRFYLLTALVERSTPAERELALSQVASFRPLILAALQNELSIPHALATT